MGMLLLPALLPALLIACGGDAGDAPPPPGGTADSGSTPAGVDDTACGGAPDVSWQGWGRGFMATYCDGCHAADTSDRHGAPEDVNFDTLDQLRAQAERVRVRTLENQDMPPGGGVIDDDLWLLDAFLACGL
jgi:mono/diheme cytochrome c family protein